MSFAQQRLWFVQQLEPNNNSYNVPCALHLQGKLDIAILERTLNQICQRHEVFRTTFITTEEKQPLSVIAPYQPFTLPIVDLRGIDSQESKISSIIKEKSQEPFDLTKPLLRLKLLHLDEEKYILLIVTHHIISDRWSIGVFLREMTLLYQGLLTNPDFTVPELPIQL